MDLYSALSLRTRNALDALVTREQVRFKYMPKQSVLLAGSRIKSGSEFQAIGPATENARRAVSVEPETRYGK